MRSDYLKMLNDQILPLMENFFPDDISIFKDDNFRHKSCVIAETCGNNVAVNVSVNKAN